MKSTKSHFDLQTPSASAAASFFMPGLLDLVRLLSEEGIQEVGRAPIFYDDADIKTTLWLRRKESVTIR